MRIATGGFTHETNSYSTLPITQEMIDQYTDDAAGFLANYTGVHNTLGGIIDEANRLDIELVPTIFFHPCPSAPTERKAFEAYRDKLVSLLWAAHCEKPLDGIMLDMHGAGIAEGYDDLEGELLRAVRARFGAGVPISISLDLHGNISQEMYEYADIMSGFKCYPHVDGYETTTTAVRLLHQMILQGKPFAKAFVKLPWHIAPAYGSTLSGPARTVQQYLYELIASEPDLLDATFFHGFAYSDIPQAGVSVVAFAKTQEVADRCANAIAKYAWSLRKEFALPANSAQTAMDLAEQAEYPVVINESSDNPGGGSPGDGTYLLREMLKRNLPGSAFGHIYDPDVVQQAVAAGVGKHIRCSLGAKNDDRHGTPIEIEDAYVKTISDGTYVCQNPMEGGRKKCLGTSVLLVVGNVQIVVSSSRQQTMDACPFQIMGINWQEQRILALKSTHHFKGWWNNRAKTIILCDSPGIHCADLNTFDHKYMNTSYFPFQDAVWEESPNGNERHTD